MVLAGYRWLSDKSDKVTRSFFSVSTVNVSVNFDHGADHQRFSSGAYQVRVLAGMMDKVRLIWDSGSILRLRTKVRLILWGNEEQIPLSVSCYVLFSPSFHEIISSAYELYANLSGRLEFLQEKENSWKKGKGVSGGRRRINDHRTLQGDLFETGRKSTRYRCLVCFNNHCWVLVPLTQLKQGYRLFRWRDQKKEPYWDK